MTGQAIDLYDPDGVIDEWCNSEGGAQCGVSLGCGKNTRQRLKGGATFRACRHGLGRSLFILSARTKPAPFADHVGPSHAILHKLDPAPTG